MLSRRDAGAGVCAEAGSGARGSCRRSRTSPLGGAPVWWRRGLAAGWGCRCLSTPSEPVHFRLFRPCRTTRRILCVVCRRQWSKLGLKGSEGTFGRREDIEMLIATGTSRGTTGISECPPFSAYSSFSFCLSVYAQGCVLCTGVWVEASACVWQRGCLSSRRSATPTRRRSWRGQVALAATQLHLNSSFPLRLLRLPNSMLCVVVWVERSACVLVRRRRWRSCRISGCFSGLCGYFYGAAGSTSEQNIHF